MAKRDKIDIIAMDFPYCIKHTKGNRYILLNKIYKPLGATEWIDDYDTHESVFTAHITKQQAKKLSYNHSDDTEWIYLYNKLSQVTYDKEQWNEYCDKLRLVSKISGQFKFCVMFS